MFESISLKVLLASWLLTIILPLFTIKLLVCLMLELYRDWAPHHQRKDHKN